MTTPARSGRCLPKTSLSEPTDQRHSEGAYFASTEPATMLPRPRLVAVAFVALAQAQSIAPCEAAVGAAF